MNIHCLRNSPQLPHLSGSEVLKPSIEPLLLSALSPEVSCFFSDFVHSFLAYCLPQLQALTHRAWTHGTHSWLTAGSLTSGSLCSDGVATAQADTKAVKATSKSLKADADNGPPRLPDVAILLNTMRKRLEALNGPDLPRI